MRIDEFIDDFQECAEKSSLDYVWSASGDRLRRCAIKVKEDGSIYFWQSKAPFKVEDVEAVEYEDGEYEWEQCIWVELKDSLGYMKLLDDYKMDCTLEIPGFDTILGAQIELKELCAKFDEMSE